MGLLNELFFYCLLPFAFCLLPFGLLPVACCLLPVAYFFSTFTSNPSFNLASPVVATMSPSCTLPESSS